MSDDLALLTAELDTVPVTATVLQIQRVEADRLLALADIELQVAGLAIGLRGIRVIRTAVPGVVAVEAPCYRRRDGVLAPAVTLPEELAAAIAGAVLDEFALSRSAAAAWYSPGDGGG